MIRVFRQYARIPIIYEPNNTYPVTDAWSIYDEGQLVHVLTQRDSLISRRCMPEEQLARDVYNHSLEFLNCRDHSLHCLLLNICVTLPLNSEAMPALASIQNSTETSNVLVPMRPSTPNLHLLIHDELLPTPTQSHASLLYLMDHADVLPYSLHHLQQAIPYSHHLKLQPFQIRPLSIYLHITH